MAKQPAPAMAVNSQHREQHLHPHPGAVGPGRVPATQLEEHSSVGQEVSGAEVKNAGSSPVVQQLTLHASTAGATGSIAGQGTEILHATKQGQKVFKKKPTLILSVKWQWPTFPSGLKQCLSGRRSSFEIFLLSHWGEIPKESEEGRQGNGYSKA